MTQRVVPPVSEDFQQWARKLTKYLGETEGRLQYKTGSEVATNDGILMWDRSVGLPVISTSNEFRSIPVIVPAPTTAADTGIAGQIAYDANYIYICTATNTWKRVAIATW